MSRFFATQSESESESSSEEEQVTRQPVAAFSFSDDDEDTKRVVRSAREKRFEDLQNTIKQMRNYKKIKDLKGLLSSFDDLTQVYEKAFKTVILKEENGAHPRFYIGCLVELDDFINKLWEDKEGRKNLSKNNSKSLATLRQKLRKYIKDKDFENDMSKFRENPDLPDEDEEKDDDSESDDESDVPTGAQASKKSGSEVSQLVSFAKGTARGDDDDASDSSMDWGSSDDTTSSSSEDEGQYQSIRERFLKRTTDKEDDEKKERKKDRKEKPKKQRKDDDGESEGEWETVKGGATIPSEKPKMFAKDAEINIEAVLKKLNEVIAARGKKRTDRREQIELLHELQAIAENHNLGLGMAVKIKLATISAIFDYNQKVSDPMKPEYWAKLLDRITECLALILSANDIVISEKISEEDEVVDKSPYRIHGYIITVVERLDEEFTKLLKECDPHSNEYVQRLKDETRVVEIIDQIQTFLEKSGEPAELCSVYMRKIEHLYYKFDPKILKQKKGEISETEITSLQVMDKLCKFIYHNDSTDRLRTRAILSHVYHHALHDNWFQARDLILMSHLQESIHHSDPPTQILYNRTMAHLGLCAFRQGNVKDAHNCLVDLMMTAKVKELLAQGLLPQRQHERSKEQEKIEKQRQMPFHMHINLELLECVYLVAAMLIEIPYMAAHEFDARRRMISKTFYQQLRSSERQSLVGPPESMREHIVAASKAMRNGNWQACINYIVNEKMNAKVWDLFYESDKVREMLIRLIKEESLRTFLFTYSNVYASISVQTLADMFQLDEPVVHSNISKMIINEELLASLDDPTRTVVMHRSEPSRLQSIALQLADKVNNFVDSNERIFEMKSGNFFQRGGQNQGGASGNQNTGSNQNYRQNSGNQNMGSNQNYRQNSGNQNMGSNQNYRQHSGNQNMGSNQNYRQNSGGQNMGSNQNFRQSYNRQNTTGGGQDWNRQRNKAY